MRESHTPLVAGGDCPNKEPMDSFMRNQHAGLIDRAQRGLQDHRVHGISPFSFNFLTKESGNITNIVNVLEREGRGHPGYMIRCIETLEEFSSQDKAAFNENVSSMIMSLHIRGKIPDVNGLYFERVSLGE